MTQDELRTIMHPALADELFSKLPHDFHNDLFPMFKQDNSAVLFERQLAATFTPASISTPTKEQRVWEIIGLFYLNQSRHHEALTVFSRLYNHMLKAQEKGNWVHKGMPLVYIADCYKALDCPVLGKKYLMLTLCEDAIRGEGSIKPNMTGIYFRLVWQYGLSDGELQAYAQQIYKLHQENPSESLFPEWILQSLDRNWMTELPSIAEISVYKINREYTAHLLAKLGDGSGKLLEQLAEYILSCMPGCRTQLRKKTHSTDYDIICSMDGMEADFRSEMGRYFVCECKDWDRPADFSTMAKFCRVLDSVKSKFGILFSKDGISGTGKLKYAEREQLKVFQDRGMVIVVINLADLKQIADGGNFVSMLRSKYEKIRLDLIEESAE